jgi:lipopolysaccharide heptosyltransferase II
MPIINRAPRILKATAMATTTWQTARRILCVRLDTLGDVLMTTPAIRALRESLADSHITLWTSPAGREAGRLVPEIDAVRVYEPPWMKATPPREDAEYEFAELQWLRSQRFDAAVIFTVYSQNPLPAALMCYLAGIPRRLAHCRENPYQLLTDWAPELEPHALVRHEVQRQLDLVESIGCRTSDPRLSIQASQQARGRIARLLEQQGIACDRPCVVVHPGASAVSRRYPAVAFAETVRQLVHEHGLQVIFTGGAHEEALIEEVRSSAEVSAPSLAGQLSLAELAALLDSVDLLLANNTGPVHVAAAVGTPVVDLYALTNPQHTPWQVPHRVLSHDVPCKYCYKSVCPHEHGHCLSLIPPQKVVEAVLDLLAETDRRSIVTNVSRRF